MIHAHSFAECERETSLHAHLHPLRRAFAPEKENGLGISSVLCIDKRPAAYFKTVADFDAKKERDWHRQVWNQGTAAMLIVEDRRAVRVYSAMVPPRADRITPPSDSRLIEQLERAEFLQHQAQFFRSIATGWYYQKNESRFLSARPVDEYLLDNLSATRDKLCDKNQKDHLSPETADVFLGRTLFTCYLLERGIIGTSHLKDVNARSAKTLKRVLESIPTNSECINILYRLFRRLQEDFNGSLFGEELPGEEVEIRAWHIEALKQFLSGSDVKSGQQAFPQFDIYDFRFIPIELISGIYEHFLSRGKNETLNESEDDEGEMSKRRRAGAYYTPPRLAELVIDIAVAEWPTLLQKRFLDPACGSGIFLVILFHRMAEEWRWRNPDANNIERALKLREFLISNFCGVDLDPTACMIACFSLYLAFMEQLEPRDIKGLNKELSRQNAGKILPPLMRHQSKAMMAATSVIHCANFFDDDSVLAGDFDLVVGNPPWKGRKHTEGDELEGWLLGCKPFCKNPYLREWIAELGKEPPRSERKVRFFPQDQSAIGFMWKAPSHAGSTGQVCLLVPSRVIMSNDTDTFQAAWFSRFRVFSLWQLADYRHILFRGAVCPAVIINYAPNSPSIKTIPYLTPKAERLDPRLGTLPILPEDIKKISLTELINGAQHSRAFTVWKKQFWGTQRDSRLIDRLLAMQPLSAIAGEVEEHKRWNKGQGFQPRNAKTKDPAPVFWKNDDLFLDAKNTRPDLILVEDDCKPIGDRFKEGLHRPREQAIYRPPMILINQTCTRFVYSDFPVLFQDSLRSITASKEDDDLLLFLCAVLNSPLASYFYFHVSANLGIERDKVYVNELLLSPFPLPDGMDDPRESWSIVREAAAAFRKLRTQLTGFKFDQQRNQLLNDAKEHLTQLVYKYYDITTWEQQLIEDTLEVFKQSMMPSKVRLETVPTLRQSSLGDRSAYVQYLCSTLNKWAYRQPWRLSAKGFVDSDGGLHLLTLSRNGRPAYQEMPADTQFSNTLQQIHNAASKNEGTVTYLRGFYLIDTESIHILKPLQYRHWTKTAALNDADELWSALLQMGESR